MPYLFTSESVSEGHPDKVADQISDAILDEYLRQDPTAKVACETLVTTDFALVAGEIKSTAHVEAEPIVREVIRRWYPGVKFDVRTGGHRSGPALRWTALAELYAELGHELRDPF